MNKENVDKVKKELEIHLKKIQTLTDEYNPSRGIFFNIGKINVSQLELAIQKNRSDAEEKYFNK